MVMSKLVKWLNTDLDIHLVLVSSIAQFQLVHIHSFLARILHKLAAIIAKKLYNSVS